MTEPMMSDPSEADVKAAEEIEWMLSSYSDTDTTEDEQRIKAENIMVLSRALASARAEGEAAGVAKEREAVVRWLRETVDQMRGVLHQFEGERLVSAQRAYARKHAYGNAAASIERGDHLRALTPEGR